MIEVNKEICRSEHSEESSRWRYFITFRIIGLVLISSIVNVNP